MEFAGDPQPLLVRAPACRLGPLRPLPRPLLAAGPGQLRQGGDGHHPGGDHELLSPGRGRVPGRRQPPVEPVRHQGVPGPQGAHRRPRGPAVPGDDGAEAGHRDGHEHRAVRVSCAEVDQGGDRRAEHDRHRVPLPPQQGGSRHEEQYAREGVQCGPLRLLGVGGEAGADQHERRDEHGGAPGPGGALFLVAPPVPPRGPVPPPLRCPARALALSVHDRHARRRAGRAASPARGDHAYSRRSTALHAP